MPVRQLKTVPNCSICKHPKRDEMDAVLEKRSLKTINGEQALVELAALGLNNPRLDGNVKNHWGSKKHSYVVTEDQVAKDNEQALAILEALANGDQQFEDIDEGLRFMATVYLRQQKEKFARGEDLGISHDQFLKITAEMTKRKHNDAEEGLLRAITGGIGAGFANAIGAKVSGELTEGDVIEAEAVEVE